MGKVGRWVTDPKAGAYCTITLDSGEQVLINHEKGGFKGGWLRIERVKLFGLSSDSIFACDLDSDDGKTALSFLARDAQEKASTRRRLEPSSSTSSLAGRSMR